MKYRIKTIDTSVNQIPKSKNMDNKIEALLKEYNERLGKIRRFDSVPYFASLGYESNNQLWCASIAYSERRIYDCVRTTPIEALEVLRDHIKMVEDRHIAGY